LKKGKTKMASPTKEMTHTEPTIEGAMRWKKVFNEVADFIDKKRDKPQGSSKSYHFLYFIWFDTFSNPEVSQDIDLLSLVDKFAVEFCAIMQSIMDGTISEDAGVKWDMVYFFSLINSRGIGPTLADPSDKFKSFFGDVHFRAGHGFPMDFEPSDELTLDIIGQAQCKEYIAGLIMYFNPKYTPPFSKKVYYLLQDAYDSFKVMYYKTSMKYRGLTYGHAFCLHFGYFDGAGRLGYNDTQLTELPSLTTDDAVEFIKEHFVLIE
jgi:hypothetical protein